VKPTFEKAREITGRRNAAMPVEMPTRSLAVEGDAMHYEFAVVWESRSTGQRLPFTGMTYHRVDAQGLLLLCREYFESTERARAGTGRTEVACP
jgi:hypothetical protein